MKGMTILASVFIALVTVSCGTNKKAVAVTDFSGEWNIVNVKGQAVSGEDAPYIGFDQMTNRVYGHAGCNRLMGAYHVDSLEAGKISFAQVATTRMMCPDMSLEQSVLDALDKVAGFAQTGDMVELQDAEGRQVMTLQKRVKPAVTIDDLAGRWRIASVGVVVIGKMDREPELTFNLEEKRVHGNAGCNTINGSFSQEEGKPASLRFSQMISTMMACPDMQVERDILQAIEKVRGFDSGDEEDTIVLLDENGSPLMTLARAQEEVE